MTKKRDRRKQAAKQHELMTDIGCKAAGWRNKRRPIVKGKNKIKVKT